MKIETKKINEVSVVELFDRVDASSSNNLKEMIQGMIDKNEVNLLINLENVSFIDSSGLGTLITCLKSINKAGGHLKIAQPCSNVKSVFDMTRMDRVFEIFDSDEAALKSFGPEAN